MIFKEKINLGPQVTKKQFVSGSVWKIIEQFLTKGISLITSAILARILLPEDYGLIALTTVFTNLSDVLIDGGFSTTLIRKEHVDDSDYACVFSISSSISLVLYLVLFFAAPAIANYYVEPNLIPVLRVIGLTFFIQAFASTRNAVVNRNMQFKFLFYCNAISSIISGALGIAAAYFGLGVWALVIQRLSQQALLTILLFIKIHFKLSWKFSLTKLKEMMKFSLGVVGSSFLNYLGGNVYSAVIGKAYSVTDLGYYDKGGQLPMQMSLYTFGAMSNVLLPTISSCQSDLERVKAIIRKVVSMTSFLIMPMMVGMVFVSKELMVLLFTDKWLPAVPIMQYTCLYYLATPFMLINVQVFFALGESQLRVKTELIRLSLNIMGLIVFGLVLGCSMNDLALVSALVAVISALVTFVEAQKLINYKWKELILDMIKPLIASAIMAAWIFIINYFVLPEMGTVLSLICKVVTGVIVYWLFSVILHIDGYREVIGMLRGLLKKGKNNG